MYLNVFFFHFTVLFDIKLHILLLVDDFFFLVTLLKNEIKKNLLKHHFYNDPFDNTIFLCYIFQAKIKNKIVFFCKR